MSSIWPVVISEGRPSINRAAWFFTRRWPHFDGLAIDCQEPVIVQPVDGDQRQSPQVKLIDLHRCGIDRRLRIQVELRAQLVPVEELDSGRS